MKTLLQYVNDKYLYEGLSESDIQLLNEGIGSTLGKLFGWASSKTQNMVKDFKDSYATTLTNTLTGKKSKDKKVQQDSEELQNKLKDCESEKEALEKYMEYAETLLRTLDKVEDPLWPISVRNVLNKLSKKLDDKDASNMAGKLDKAINEKWPEKDVKNATETLERTGTELENKAKVEANQNGGSENGAKSEKGADTKNLTNKAMEVMKEEKDVLGPLAKEAGLEGKYLLDYITNKISKTNKKSDNPIDPESDNFKKLVLGMCITVCGAIITNDPNLFAKISDMLELQDKTVKDLKKRIQWVTSKKKSKEKESK